MNSKEIMKGSSCWRVDRELQSERGAPFRSRPDRQFAPQHLGQSPGDWKTQPRTDAGMRIESLERLEQSVHRLRRNARSIVMDMKLDRAVIRANGDLHPAVVGRVAHGITEEIHENLLQADGVGPERHMGRWRVDGERD